jgi:hypothetical protein
MAKQVKKIGEEAKIAVRHHRQEGNAKAKSFQKEQGWSEDEVKRTSDEVQKLTDSYVKKVDDLCASKEKEVLTVGEVLEIAKNIFPSNDWYIEFHNYKISLNPVII